MLRELKARRLRGHKTLGQLASELLAQALGADAGEERDQPFEWIDQPMGARVNLADKAAVYQALDSG